MIFYDCLTAPSPRRARIFLAEKKVAHKTVLIDLAKGEQLSAEYRQINPRCTVPALALDDGVVLCENAGIAQYLEAAFPSNPLLGRTATERGQIADWTAVAEFDGLFAIAEALRNSSPALKDRALTGPDNYAQIPALAERGLKRLSAFFDRLNSHLIGKPFVVGSHFTNADITAAVAVDFARIVRVKPCETHAEIKRWRDGLNARDSMSL